MTTFALHMPSRSPSEISSNGCDRHRPAQVTNPSIAPSSVRTRPWKAAKAPGSVPSKAAETSGARVRAATAARPSRELSVSPTLAPAAARACAR